MHALVDEVDDVPDFGPRGSTQSTYTSDDPEIFVDKDEEDDENDIFRVDDDEAAYDDAEGFSIDPLDTLQFFDPPCEPSQEDHGYMLSPTRQKLINWPSQQSADFDTPKVQISIYLKLNFSFFFPAGLCHAPDTAA
jgi:hypothetical protein